MARIRRNTRHRVGGEDLSLTTAQIARAKARSVFASYRVYVGAPRENAPDLSGIYPGSNITVGGTTGWMPLVVSGDVVAASGAEGPSVTISGIEYDGALLAQGVRRYLLIKGLAAGDGQSTGWQDWYLLCLGEGASIRQDAASKTWTAVAVGEQIYLDRATAAPHNFSPVNLAVGKQAEGAALAPADAELAMERFQGGSVGPEKAIDGVRFATVWISPYAPRLDGDYYVPPNPASSPVTGFRTYVINEVFAHDSSIDDTETSSYVEIIACKLMTYNAAGTVNLGQFYNWAGSLLLADNGVHRNGNSISLVTGQVLPSGATGQVLRSTATANNHAHLKYINDQYHNTQMGIATWNYHWRPVFRVNLPAGNTPHYVRYRVSGDNAWKYLRATGGWQLFDVDGVCEASNNATSYMSLQIDAWSSNNDTGSLDRSVSSIDFYSLQIIGGAPIVEFAPETPTHSYIGLGNLHLAVTPTGESMVDLDLSRYNVAATKGLQSILLVRNKRKFEERFGTCPGSLVIETGELRWWINPSSTLLTLYSAAVIRRIPCEDGDPGCQHGSIPATVLARVDHDATTISTSSGYPTNANYAWQRRPGLSGAFASNIYPSPGSPVIGSQNAAHSTDLGAVVWPQLSTPLGTVETALELQGDLSYIVVPGWIKIGAEYLATSSIDERSLYVIRNSAPPGTTSTLGSHSAGDLAIPMLLNTSGSGYHPQAMHRVASVVIRRAEGRPIIQEAVLLGATTAAALPTAEDSAGWTILTRWTQNSSATLTWAAPIPLELQRVAVLIYQMGYRTDSNSGVRARAAINEIEIYQYAANAAHTYVTFIEDAIAHLWGDYGIDGGYQRSQQLARYIQQPWLRVPIINLTTHTSSYWQMINQLAASAALSAHADEWGRLNLQFSRSSGLGLAPGQLPIFAFDKTSVRSVSIQAEPHNATSMVKMSGTDALGRTYQESYPPRPARYGKVEERNDLHILSQSALQRQCRALYNSLNRGYSVAIEVGFVGDWLRRNQLVTLSWQFDAGSQDFNGTLFVVRDWQTTISAGQVKTTIYLEERILV